MPVCSKCITRAQIFNSDHLHWSLELTSVSSDSSMTTRLIPLSNNVCRRSFSLGDAVITPYSDIDGYTMYIVLGELHLDMIQVCYLYGTLDYVWKYVYKWCIRPVRSTSMTTITEWTWCAHRLFQLVNYAEDVFSYRSRSIKAMQIIFATVWMNNQ